VVYENSRFAACQSSQAGAGRMILGERSPYSYRPHADNVIHRVVEGDTLQLLAGAYFSPLQRACGYWWAIADFQPEPTLNPLVSLYLQRAHVVVPSLRVLTDHILPRRVLN